MVENVGGGWCNGDECRTMNVGGRRYGRRKWAMVVGGRAAMGGRRAMSGAAMSGWWAGRGVGGDDVGGVGGCGNVDVGVSMCWRRRRAAGAMRQCCDGVAQCAQCVRRRRASAGVCSWRIMKWWWRCMVVVRKCWQTAINVK